MDNYEPAFQHSNFLSNKEMTMGPNLKLNNVKLMHIKLKVQRLCNTIF